MRIIVGGTLALILALQALPHVPPWRRARAAEPASAAPVAQRQADSGFARLVQRLSEPGGYFDSDNLISNEASYLHVLGALQRVGVSGGAYIGVGPDQNFSYIAQVRPRIAYLIDIRRDNLLQHLLFKSLFAMSRNRVEYLSLLFGRPVPADVRRWDARSVGDLVAYIDSTPMRPARAAATRAAILARARSTGVPLSASDTATIGRIYDSFAAAGLDLKFTSSNRPPRWYYPDFRQLVLERDLTGRHANYLAREEDFQFVKSLQARDLVVPVVGNLAGPHALAAIGRAIAARGETVSAFYTSNVEQYLMREGSFDRFIENVKQLPRDERSVLIRSYFGGSFGTSLPHSVPGYYSTQLAQTLDALLREHAAGALGSYFDVVTRGILPP